ncbi:hypothetical protein MHYP_G00300550 [Metynnis hypsauchen]
MRLAAVLGLCLREISRCECWRVFEGLSVDLAGRLKPWLCSCLGKGWRQAGATVKEGESDLHGAGPIRRSGGIDREGPLEEAASPQPHRGGQHTQPHRDTDGPCVCERGPKQIYSHESAEDSRAGAKERQYGGRGGGPAQDPPPKKPFHIRIVSAFFPCGRRRGGVVLKGRLDNTAREFLRVRHGNWWVEDQSQAVCVCVRKEEGGHTPDARGETPYSSAAGGH